VEDTKWLIAREIPHLRRYALALTRDPDEADDLVQDCLERAIRKRHLWRRTGRIRSWLFRLMYRQFLDRRTTSASRRTKVPLDTVESEVTEASPPVTDQETQLEFRKVIQALDRLPNAQRETILLVALEGVSYDEAAWILGIPIGTVRSRLARGRDMLYRLRQDEGQRQPLLKRVK